MNKRSLYSCILMLMLLLPFAAGASRLYVESTSLERGKTQTLQFILDNQGMEVYGFQADVWLPDGVEPARRDDGNLDITLSDRAADGGYTLTSNIISNGAIRMGTFSTNRTPFTGDNGVLINMVVNVSPDFNGGTIGIENILLIDRESSDIPLDSSFEYVNPIVEVASVWFDQAEMTLTEGDQGWLYANVDPWDATDQSVVWTSSNESVATVYTEDGRGATITAITEGETVISATSSNGISASCTVRVEKRFIDVLYIYISQDNASMTEGDSMTLTATIEPADATDKTIIWISSDESIAIVNANGSEATVTAISPGYVEVYAQASNGVSTTCCINVEARFIEVSGISLNQSELNLIEGDTAWLNATVSPDDATDRTITWTSSDESVATVSADGEVRAIRPGTATITVSSANGITASCSVTVAARTIEVSGIIISTSELRMTEGESATLTASIQPADATDKSLAWSSSDETVATVSPEGEVKAIQEGEATITVKAANGISATCRVSVESGIIVVTSVTLDKSSLELTEGDSAQLTATVNPTDATDKTLIWTSSDESVATISADGEVKGLKPGTATITVSSVNGKTATCTVNVAKRIIEVTGIVLSSTELRMTEGNTAILTANAQPADATDKTLTWTSSDVSVASVSVNGEVKALKLGTATITVKASNGVSATCRVTVESGIIGVTSVNLDKSSLELTEGDSAQLTATVNPTDATDKTLIWTSSDESVATISADGEVKALKPGTATITVSSANGKTATCTVNVAKRIIEVTGIVLSSTELRMTEGNTAILTANVQPTDATDKTLIWTSSDESVATVSADGEVRAIRPGTATITVSSANGITASCIVTVNPILAEFLTISPEAWEGEEGTSFNITAVVLPENTSDKSLSWESSDVSVATVDADGNVNVLKEGTCIITVSTLDGSGLKAECHITGLAGIDQIFSDADARVNVYSLNGILIKRDCSREELESLQPDFYILRSHRGNSVFIKR